MSDEKKRPEERDEDRPEVEEVVSEFGDIRVKSGFEIEEVQPGQLEINLFGPIFEFDDEDDLDEEDLDLEDEDGNQESHDEAEESP